MPTEPIPTRTYEVEYDEGSGTARVRIEIPETWKVTFGPIMGAGAKAAGYMGALAFRVWESDTKQRFLLSNVKSFRDLSIPVTMAAVRAFGQETWHANTGQFEGPLNIEALWAAFIDAKVAVLRRDFDRVVALYPGVVAEAAPPAPLPLDVERLAQAYANVEGAGEWRPGGRAMSSWVPARAAAIAREYARLATPEPTEDPT